MRLNKNHPKYEEYQEKYNKILEGYKKESTTMPFTLENSEAHDAIRKKTNVKVKILMQEYQNCYKE